MSTSRILPGCKHRTRLHTLALCCCAIVVTFTTQTPVYAQQEKVRLGTPVSETQLADFDQIIDADGSGLPAGSGTASQGESIYNAKCQACHGASGEGLSAATRLAGGSLHDEGAPVRTIGSYWPYATTIFDFVRRAMPADAPKSLSDLEVYQLTAYLLYMNGIIEKDFQVDKNNLARINMPNAEGFIDRSHLQ